MKPAQPEGFEAWWEEYAGGQPGAPVETARAAYLAGMRKAAEIADADAARHRINYVEMFARHCSEVYMYASGGLISKPNTYPSAVIGLSEERENRDVEEATAELQAQVAQLEAERGPIAQGRDLAVAGDARTAGPR
jgi:hypothetical protein